MTPERWKRIGELYQATLDRPAAAQRAFLEGECGEDRALLQEVLSLLASHSSAENFLDAGAMEDAARVAPVEQSTVSLTGKSLGSYQVISLLGTGGMGEVYRARDVRLGREVAVKVLAREVTLSEEARARFEREARTVAALSHPNILSLYDVGESDGRFFAVMELLVGETLRARLDRGALPWREAVDVAVAVADGLAAAHAKGIIHRDVKPENIFLTSDGRIKVLDFGLAKLAEPAGLRGEDATTLGRDGPDRLSHTGAIVGTPLYMSPEQATGGTLDVRSDVFSFGAMLYEMVTGRRAFAGATRNDTLRAVVSQSPDSPRQLVPTLPADLEKLILRCLRKEPERRFQHVSDVRIELLEIQEASRATPVRPRLVLGGAAAAALLGAVGWGVHFFSAPAPPPRLTPLTAYPGEELHPALSPDGEQVAFSWQGENVDESKPPTRHIFLKLVGGSEIRQLTQDVAIDSDPSWSPDGRQIAFIRQSRLFTISPLGGQARKLSDFSVGFFSQLSWTVDGEWIAATHTGVGSVDDPAPGAIHLVSTTGKPPRTLTRPVQGGVDRFPIISPDGRQLAYASCGAGPQGILVLPCRVHVVDVGGSASAAKVLVSKPVSVIGLAWSPDGRSVICSERGPRAALWRLDASGVRPPERIELTVGRRAVGVSISGRRQRLVFSSQKGIYELWALESTGEKRRLLTSPEYLATPSFSPDGRRVAFCSGRSGESIEIWLADGDGTNLTQLTHGPGYWQCMPRWSPDGKRIAFNSMEDDGKRNLWTIDVAGGAPRRMTHGPFGETNGGWFPDGRTMYYRQDHAAGSDVWRLSDNGTPIRLTDKGGSNPLLVPEGDVLLYTRRRLRSALVARRLETGMETELVSCVNGRDFDVGGGGLYYLGCPDMLRGFPLFRMDLATRLTTPLGRLDHDDQDGIAVSPLGWPVLYRKHLPAADLMLIENFR